MPPSWKRTPRRIENVKSVPVGSTSHRSASSGRTRVPSANVTSPSPQVFARTESGIVVANAGSKSSTSTYRSAARTRPPGAGAGSRKTEARSFSMSASCSSACAVRFIAVAA